MKASPAMRTWFILFAVLIWIGIFLTGFSNVHWLLYIPPAGMTFAALTGICPSLAAVNKVWGA